MVHLCVRTFSQKQTEARWRSASLFISFKDHVLQRVRSLLACSTISVTFFFFSGETSDGKNQVCDVSYCPPPGHTKEAFTRSLPCSYVLVVAVGYYTCALAVSLVCWFRWGSDLGSHLRTHLRSMYSLASTVFLICFSFNGNETISSGMDFTLGVFSNEMIYYSRWRDAASMTGSQWRTKWPAAGDIWDHHCMISRMKLSTFVSYYGW